MADYTTTALLARCRLWTASSSGTPPSVSDIDLLDILNEELRSVITPLIMTFNSDYLVAYEDKVLDLVTAEWALPARAIFGKLRETKIYDQGSRSYVNLPLMNLESLDNIRDRYGCYFTGNTLTIVNPEIYGVGKVLRMYYYQRPSDLVAVASAGTVTTIDRVLGTVVISGTPSAWSGSFTADCVQGRPPFGVIGKDLSVSIATNTLTFSPASTIPATLVVGDYVALPQESPVPTIPLELHNLMCQGASVKVLEISADAQGVQMALAKYQQMMKSVQSMGQSRITGQPRVIVPRNTFT